MASPNMEIGRVLSKTDTDGEITSENTKRKQKDFGTTVRSIVNAVLTARYAVKLELQVPLRNLFFLTFGCLFALVEAISTRPCRVVALLRRH